MGFSPHKGQELPNCLSQRSPALQEAAPERSPWCLGRRLKSTQESYPQRAPRAFLGTAATAPLPQPTLMNSSSLAMSFSLV